MLNKVRIVLVNTSHPGNIGSAVRAMKTMGLDQLYLVEPAHFPHPKAKEMAAGAGDLLDRVKRVDTLEEAIQDCTLVVGTSARMRTIPWPLFNPKEVAEQIKQTAREETVAILFGREQSGLTNEELQSCHIHMHIPTDHEYSSLNIAAAVQVVAYELRMCDLNPTENITKKWDYRLATANEMENYFYHLQTVLTEIDFLKKNAPRQSMTRLRRLFLRARPDIMEINMLRGVLTAIQQRLMK